MTNRRGSLRGVVGVVPLAVAVLCAGVASADDSTSTQPGSTVDAQPGSTDIGDAQSSGAQPGSTGTATPPVEYSPTPPVAYQPPASQAQYDDSTPGRRDGTPAMQHQRAEPDTLRVGYYLVPTPSWVPPEVRRNINHAARDTRSRIVENVRGMGVGPSRANRVADSSITGAVNGAAAGAVIGAIAGAVAGLPFLVVGAVPGLVIGAAAGATVGAAIGGATTGIASGVDPGMLIGAATGARAHAVSMRGPLGPLR